MSNVKELLDFDSLAEAEKITGKSYKEDEETSKLGFLMHILHGQNKREQLKNLNDTYIGISWNETLEIINDLKFIEIYSNEVEVEEFSKCIEIEKHFMRKDGILLFCETFNRKSPNTIHLYYQIEIIRDNTNLYFNKIGGNSSPFDCDEKIFRSDCSKDGREGLRYIVNTLEGLNCLLYKWKKKNTFLWLLGWWEKDQHNNYKEISQNKINTWPQWAREIIGR